MVNGEGFRDKIKKEINKKSQNNLRVVKASLIEWKTIISEEKRLIYKLMAEKYRIEFSAKILFRKIYCI